MIIYVAGKYSGDTVTEQMFNTYKAIDVGIEIMMKGHYPLIPHLSHFLDERMGNLGLPKKDKDWWYALDNKIIPYCQGFIKISSSLGADMEEQLATSLGLTMFKSVQEIPYA